MKKTIKICYVDFWKGFNPDFFGFTEIMNKKYNVIIDSNNPNYVFYSVFGSKHLEYKNAIKIFYTGECCTPNFNECDYAIGFDYITFEDRYLRYPLSIVHLKHKRKEFNKNNYKNKKFCCMVVSNNWFAMKERELFFQQLSKYKKVDSGGKAFNNIGFAVENKLDFLRQYKFNICFENRIYPGYNTEKIVDAFVAGCIPIYLGDPKIGLQFNEEAFVNVAKFKNFDAVINRIIEIDNDEKLFNYIRSQPILKKPIEDNLSKFLYHIFDQDFSDAIRCRESIAPYLNSSNSQMEKKNGLIRKIIKKIKRCFF